MVLVVDKVKLPQSNTRVHLKTFRNIKHMEFQEGIESHFYSRNLLQDSGNSSMERRSVEKNPVSKQKKKQPSPRFRMKSR